MGPAFGRSSMGPFRRASMPGGRVDDAPPHAHPRGGGAPPPPEEGDTPHPRSRTDEWRVIHTGALRPGKRARTHTGAAPYPEEGASSIRAPVGPGGSTSVRTSLPGPTDAERSEAPKKKADRAPSVEAGSRGAASVS